VGDWVVGTGSKEFGFENQMIYAMKVSRILSIKEYDAYCRKQKPKKIPVRRSTNSKLWVGDCIYDYKTGVPVLRPSVHKEENMETDLGGENVLLSNHFYYFGSEPIPLPNHLLPIVKQGQGHKSISNEPYQEQFIMWINSFTKFRNKVNAPPYGLNDFLDDEKTSRCCKVHLDVDKEDENLRSSGC
jgi:hypothetical protein